MLCLFVSAMMCFIQLNACRLCLCCRAVRAAVRISFSSVVSLASILALHKMQPTAKSTIPCKWSAWAHTTCVHERCLLWSKLRALTDVHLLRATPHHVHRIASLIRVCASSKVSKRCWQRFEWLQNCSMHARACSVAAASHSYTRMTIEQI